MSERLCQNDDPWQLRLERVRGQVGDDGIERITTRLLFDVLEVPQRRRGAGACRSLAKLMAEIGWTAVRVRGLTGGGYLECLNSVHILGTSVPGVEEPSTASTPDISRCVALTDTLGREQT